MNKTAEQIFRETTGQRFGEINMKIVTPEQIFNAMDIFASPRQDGKRGTRPLVADKIVWDDSPSKLAEMPTDEEIERVAKETYPQNHDIFRQKHFIEGAIWMRSLFSRQEVKKGFEEVLQQRIDEMMNHSNSERFFDEATRKYYRDGADFFTTALTEYRSFLPKEDREQKPDGNLIGVEDFENESDIDSRRFIDKYISTHYESATEREKVIIRNAMDCMAIFSRPSNSDMMEAQRLFDQFSALIWDENTDDDTWVDASTKLLPELHDAINKILQPVCFSSISKDREEGSKMDEFLRNGAKGCSIAFVEWILDDSKSPVFSFGCDKDTQFLVDDNGEKLEIEDLFQLFLSPVFPDSGKDKKGEKDERN